MSETTTSPDFDDPLADIVLISSDRVAFRVRRVFLEAASSFFEDMFKLPVEANGGLQEVEMAETAEVVALLLGEIVRPPGPTTRERRDMTLDEATILLDLADKYAP